MTAEGRLRLVWRESEKTWKTLSPVAYAWANDLGMVLGAMSQNSG
jgi:hypothetical protein